MKVKTTKQRVGLIGWPVSHSVSPAMHNAAFQALGMDWTYELLPTPPGQVEQRVAEIRRGALAGANVTIPHKQAVLPFLDQVMDAAAVVGAVNTIVARGEQLVGYNTDVAGIVWAFERHAVSPRGWRVVLLGAGGAARGALYALQTLGVTAIDVFNRTPERAAALLEALRPHLGTVQLSWAPLSDRERLQKALSAAQLLVNTTAAGMHPHVEDSPVPAGVRLPANLLVFDMVYNPQKTRLLAEAEAVGAQTIGGLDMLVGQGVASFKLWTGKTPPAALMLRAAQEWLAKPR